MIIVILTVSLMSVLAFVTDFGMAYTNQRIIQNGVDAAALAAAQEIAEQAPPAYSCSAIDGTMESTTRGIAETYLAENDPTGDAALAPGHDGYDIDCSTGQLLVSATAQQTSSNFFGAVVGPDHADGIELSASAKAAVAPPEAVVRVRPIAICIVDAEALQDTPAESRNIIYDNHAPEPPAGCGSASGNFGLIDLEGGDGAPRTPDLETWIETGYEGEFGGPTDCPDADIDCAGGGPGFRAALKDEFAGLLDGSIVLPVFDEVSLRGSTTIYHIQGFISVQFCGFHIGGGGTGPVTGACYDSLAEPPVASGDDWFQVRYDSYVPSGDPSDLCFLGADCDFGTRVFRLAE
jgi:hypothetical protein